MTARDSYKGVPKKAALTVDASGQIGVPVVGGGNSVITTGSGVLVWGQAAVTTVEKLGWHCLVYLTAVSGSKTAGLQYSYVPGSKTLRVSGQDNADNRRFNYMIVNPGIGTNKP